MHWKTTPPHLLHSISVEWHIASNLATLVSSAKNHWGGLDPIFSDFGHSYLYLINIIWYIIEKWPWGSDALCQALSTIYTVDPFTLLFLPLVGPWLWGSYRLELSLMLMSEAPCQHWKTTWSIQVFRSYMISLWKTSSHMDREIRQFSKFLLPKSKRQLRNHSDINEFDQGPRHRLLHQSLKFGQILTLACTWLNDWWMNGRW